MARFGSVHAFGYNSAESEPIWMKSAGALSTLSGADPGRFWARSIHDQQLESQAKFF